MPNWLWIGIAACFYYSGLVILVRWWILRSGRCLVILNYYRASGRDLRSHLLYLRRHYHLLHLEKALEELYKLCKEGLQRPDIGDQAERLVREIELEICSEVEFRLDNAGNPYLMEINPGLWASTELAVRSGVDLPYLLNQWASEERIDTVRSYRVGGWLCHLSRGMRTPQAALRQRGRPEVDRPAPGQSSMSAFLSSCLRDMTMLIGRTLFRLGRQQLVLFVICYDG